MTQNRNDSCSERVWSSDMTWVFEVGLSNDGSLPPSANGENNRGAIMERQEGKKGMCCRIYTSWVPIAPEAFQSLSTRESSVHRICMKVTLMASPCSYKVVEHNVYSYSQLGSAPWPGISFCSENGCHLSYFSTTGRRHVWVCFETVTLWWYSKKSVTQQRRVSYIYPVISSWIYGTSTRGRGGRVERMKGKCRQRRTKNKDGKRVGNPLRPTNGNTKEYPQKGTW